ncbi:MAG TPA: acetyl ornithine aminotransferase family protein [Thermoplasmata archaeon]|uniref:Ornithine aminotransferase n=1 Tax=uncultured euryarchaeote Rifle_16ft_4_minimus_37884 TaxID=1665196 RepID=A0A0H4TQS1_9EURY|nr:4-aminobutyrate aminotransferase, 4-aminobutyrate aminotransferase [uncultured euryarchaeote Rifle_16ft_4_minimus_37884]
MKVPDIKVTPPGPKARAIIERDHSYVATTTKSAPIVIKRASGSIVEDVDGNLLIDFASGISVLNVGHAHPKVVEAISKQAKEFTHFAGTDFYYEIQTTLAERLGAITPGSHKKKVFFSNSGAEANEAAIKVAKIHTKKQMFLAFLGAFHGRTQGALALTASKAKQRAGFFPTMPGVVHVPYAYCYRCPYKLQYPSCDLYCANIIEDVYMKTVAPPADTAGVFVEPVQGEGGYIVPPPGWLDRIAKIAKDHDILLIDDEIQSGFGRTGKMWAVEHSKAVPDILTMAKSMGSGVPIGAAVYRADMDFHDSGKHSNTFGGNPIACAASLATIDVIEDEDLIARSAKIGEHMAKRLDEMAERYEFIGERRGLGMMQATEFVADRRSKKPDPSIRDAITKDAYEHGLILLPCGESSLRYIPALNIPRDVLDAGLDVLEGAFKRAAK